MDFKTIKDYNKESYSGYGSAVNVEYFVFDL